MNILLVDDDAECLGIMSKFVARLGHRVFESGNGRDALKILAGENIHIVLSDVSMPDMNGYQLLERIKGDPKLKETVVVLFTGYGDIKGAVGAMKNGAYDYLLKPIDVNELSIVIKRIGEYLALKDENVRLTENFRREVRDATRDMERELLHLRRAYAREMVTCRVGVFSDAFREVVRMAEKLHRAREIPVLIEGETGTGKEVIARLIHYGEGDVTTPFVGLNCAAISPNLFESEFFGYDPGAFSGGNPKGQKGKLELAEGGTIFLDEITEMPAEYQAKLLRVIEEREYYRVGGVKLMHTDARFVCATNRDIKKMVSEGKFRSDLYYRLNVSRLVIPPLRERPEEIVPLALMFLEEMRERNRTRFERISAAAAGMLTEYDWPGNVRELKNTLERMAFLWDDVEVKPKHLEFLFKEGIARSGEEDRLMNPDSGFPLPREGFDLKEWNRKIIEKVLEMKKWNKVETARYLNISRKMLYQYLKDISPGG